MIAAERRRFPEVYDVGAILGGEATVSEVPIPIDCVDGFCEVYYARPEAFLDPAVRQSQSSWRFVDPVAAERDLGRLREALASGEWEAEHGHLRTQPRYVGAVRPDRRALSPDHPGHTEGRASQP